MIYRPPPKRKHDFTVLAFLLEFADFLDTMAMNKSNFLIAGVYNMHMEEGSACRGADAYGGIYDRYPNKSFSRHVGGSLHAVTREATKRAIENDEPEL